MNRLSPSPKRLLLAAWVALAFLGAVILIVPTATPNAPPLLAQVRMRLKPDKPVVPKAPDLPFLAQDEPQQDQKDNPEATTADAYNRHVERQTLARRSRPARALEKRPAPTLPDPSQLQLDLGFLQKSKAQRDLDLFDLPQLEGGPTLANSDIERGERTWLSSRAVLHGGFFRRLHQAIAVQWRPGAVLRRRDPSGLLYGTSDRVTVLHLRLNERGDLLEEPKLLKGSGLRMLDQEALRAVVAAAPFRNPPRALLRKGVVDLGRFSFYLEIDRNRATLQRH
jgi:hypothetical protein